MSKKRKTKKQKMLSEMRLKLQQLEEQQKPTSSQPQPLAYSYKSVEKIPHTQIIPHKDYDYVASGMKNTLVITTLLILVNAVLFVLVERNIVNLRILGF